MHMRIGGASAEHLSTDAYNSNAGSDSARGLRLMQFTAIVFGSCECMNLPNPFSLHVSVSERHG